MGITSIKASANGNPAGFFIFCILLIYHSVSGRKTWRNTKNNKIWREIFLKTDPLASRRLNWDSCIMITFIKLSEYIYLRK